MSSADRSHLTRRTVLAASASVVVTPAYAQLDDLLKGLGKDEDDEAPAKPQITQGARRSESGATRIFGAVSPGPHRDRTGPVRRRAQAFRGRPPRTQTQIGRHRHRPFPAECRSRAAGAGERRSGSRPGLLPGGQRQRLRARREGHQFRGRRAVVDGRLVGGKGLGTGGNRGLSRSGSRADTAVELHDAGVPPAGRSALLQRHARLHRRADAAQGQVRQGNRRVQKEIRRTDVKQGQAVRQRSRVRQRSVRPVQSGRSRRRPRAQRLCESSGRLSCRGHPGGREPRGAGLARQFTHRLFRGGQIVRRVASAQRSRKGYGASARSGRRAGSARRRRRGFCARASGHDIRL